MLLNLEQIKAIDPSSLWLEITPDEIDRSTPNPQLYSNPTALSNAKFNQLCLAKFQTWLADREIAHHPSFNTTESSTMWELVTDRSICGTDIPISRLVAGGVYQCNC